MAGEDSGGEGEKRGTVPPTVAPRPSIPSLAGGARANWRIVFAAVWLAVQATLIVTADRRIDGPFDFRSYRESLTVKVALGREIDGPDGRPVRVPEPGGVWTSRARDGSYRRQTVWFDRVPTARWVFDREVEVGRGDADLGRLQSALDDVASHIAPEEDVETRRLILDVTIRRNGREASTHELGSRERLGAATRSGGT